MNTITPEEKLELAGQLTALIICYCENKSIPVHHAISALLIAYAAADLGNAELTLSVK